MWRRKVRLAKYRKPHHPVFAGENRHAPIGDYQSNGFDNSGYNISTATFVLGVGDGDAMTFGDVDARLESRVLASDNG